jgi:hypothetical protein
MAIVVNLSIKDLTSKPIGGDIILDDEGTPYLVDESAEYFIRLSDGGNFTPSDIFVAKVLKNPKITINEE